MEHDELKNFPIEIQEKISSYSSDLRHIFADYLINLFKKYDITSYPERLFLIVWAWFDFVLMEKTNIIPQYEIGRYRVDFYIPNIKTAVEIDSVAFHDRNAKQVEYERVREREIEATGVKVVRYAATEIIKDAVICVCDLRDSAKKASL